MLTLQNQQLKTLWTKYVCLYSFFPPPPTHVRVGYKKTVELVDLFAGFEELMSASHADYFDLLCDLIEKYENDQKEPITLKSGVSLWLQGEWGITAQRVLLPSAFFAFLNSR